MQGNEDIRPSDTTSADKKRKRFTLFGLPGYSSAEWVFFILGLIGISFTTITVVFQNEESVASTTIKKGSANEEHKIPSTSSLRTDTEKTAESVSVSASEVGGTSKTKEKFKTLNEKYEGISVNEQTLYTANQRYRGVPSHNEDIKNDENPTMKLVEEKTNPTESKKAKALDENHFIDFRIKLEITSTENQDGISNVKDAEDEQENFSDKLSKNDIELNNIEGFSADILDEIDVNYDYEIDVSGLPDELWGDYDDEALDHIIDVESKQESGYENTKNGYDNSIINLKSNNIRTKNSFDIIDLDTFKEEDDWNENNEKSEYADMIDVYTHIEFEDLDGYDGYDEFYVDRQNIVLNMIDTDTHNEEDEDGLNHWSQVDGARNRIDDMIDVTTFDENEIFDSEIWMFKSKDVSSYDMIDTDTFEEQMYNDEDCSDGYCVDYDDYYSYDEISWDYSDMIDLETKMEEIEIDINEDENSFYDMTNTEAYGEEGTKNGEDILKKLKKDDQSNEGSLDLRSNPDLCHESSDEFKVSF
ncbi:hypothetical protein HOLleu_03630 [Holothuria leucospilota]|uniref:Uncharacterized protein n=1 Tax=Holothuria leucospilota TaxID=206669 RepID=A0A9Q1CS85_HOLLE|nr:hypothetical protein HOLleu_03630 [Holothuria leucospilota]